MRFKSSLLIAGLSITAVLAVYAQKGQQEIGPDVSHFPTADIKVAKENKKEKSKRYNRAWSPEINESLNGIYTLLEWDVGLPALPISRSSAIIVGEVITAEAQLSADNTNIYSEFTVQVEEVLKTYKGRPLPNDVLVIERLGGRVRLPSGRIVVSQVDRQDLPQKNKRYVFFLTNYSFDGYQYEDFSILTAYELRNEKVFPLDKVNPAHPIAAYAGKSASSFFDDLSRLLGNSSLSQSN